jgi:hypothetical protein
MRVISDGRSTWISLLRHSSSEGLGFPSYKYANPMQMIELALFQSTPHFHAGCRSNLLLVILLPGWHTRCTLLAWNAVEWNAKTCVRLAIWGRIRSVRWGGECGIEYTATKNCGLLLERKKCYWQSCRSFTVLGTKVAPSPLFVWGVFHCAGIDNYRQRYNI